MGKKIEDYKAAAEKTEEKKEEHEQAIETAEQTAKDVYNNEAQQYTGDEGYTRSLEMGSEGAVRASKVAQQQAQTAARNSGMSKGAAAALGSQQAVNAYDNNLQNQQQLAYGSGTDRLYQANKLTDQANATVGQRANAVGLQQTDTERARNEKWKGVELATSGVNQALGATGEIVKAATAVSDCRTKNYKDITEALADLKDMMSPADCFSKIHAYDFTYKPEFRGIPGTDGNEHVGVMAQDLELNPATSGAVTEVNGIKAIDAGQLTTTNTAVIAELARRVQELEKTLGKRG